MNQNNWIYIQNIEQVQVEKKLLVEVALPPAPFLTNTELRVALPSTHPDQH